MEEMMKVSRLFEAFCAASLLLIPFTAVGQGEGVVDYNTESAGTVTAADEAAAGTEESKPKLMEWSAAGAAGGTAAAATPAAEDDRSKLKPWEWGARRHHSSLLGSTGLLHLTEAGSGPAGTFGIGAHMTYFKYTDYLIHGDTDIGMWGGMNLRITPLEFLEIHYNVTAAANSNNKENPVLFQSLGDMSLGLKGFYTFADWVTVGLDVSATMLNSVGDVSVDFSGTSVGLDALSTFDFAQLNRNAPLRAHLLFGYNFDNSSNLIDGLEKKYGGCGADGQGGANYKGCLSPVERTALGINRNDQLRWGIGLDALFPYISPMLEYRMEIPVNRQGWVCPRDVPGSYDKCMDQEGARAFRQVLTIGTRVLPPIEDLAIDVGVDIGLTGYAPSVHELAAEAPYRIIFGLSYNIDPFKEPPPAPPPPPPPPTPPPPPPPPAKILGMVHVASSVDRPIPEAKVTYVGQELNPQVTGRDGRFTSYPLPAGTVSVKVEADGFIANDFDVTIPETGDVEQQFGLEVEIKKGTISGQVLGLEDRPLSGIDIKVEGPTATTVTSGPDGQFELEADDGDYLLVVTAEGYLAKRIRTDVKAGAKTQVQIVLREKPKRSSVVVKAKTIQIKKKIQFKTDSAEIDPVSFDLCDEIAATIVDHPELKQIEIQGHTDDRGKRDYNTDLSERRASSVRTYLIDAGVESSRLTAKGFGPDKPLAPNITAGGRAKNRRVEFLILDKTE
jgi:OmpA-OmpF porin, OOP family